jgi:murein L,D-transpeptidase YafK
MLRTAMMAGVALWAGAMAPAASAFDIDPQIVAPERAMRQLAHNRGQLPLPGTPDIARLAERLAAKGVAKGDAIFIRIFKATSELELWMRNGDAFVLLDTYPICTWTGTLGPKLREGDKQSPEGFYSVTLRQMRLPTRWRRSFDIGFPNAFDQANKRTGSHILVHGGCTSVGCYAMTDAVQAEIHALAEAALAKGQHKFHVHVFPFRMTAETLGLHAGGPWASFWADLQLGYDAFERTRVPPRVALCEDRYRVIDGESGELPAGCRATDAEVRDVVAVTRGRGARGEVRRTSRIKPARPQTHEPDAEEHSSALNGLGLRIDKGAPRIFASGG